MSFVIHNVSFYYIAVGFTVFQPASCSISAYIPYAICVKFLYITANWESLKNLRKWLDLETSLKMEMETGDWSTPKWGTDFQSFKLQKDY